MGKGDSGKHAGTTESEVFDGQAAPAAADALAAVAGLSTRQAALQLGVSASTVRRRLRHKPR